MATTQNHVTRMPSETPSGVSTVSDSLYLYNVKADDKFTSQTHLTEVGATEEAGPDRATWGGQLEFILTCVGTAVGLGNVWRFPYLCYKNGGGAFLIPYFIMLCLVGVPLFFMELSLGQFASRGPTTVWVFSPVMKGVGYSMIVASVGVFLYYNVIVSWCLYYFFASMTSSLPWEFCDNEWNTVFCKSSFSNDSTYSDNSTTFNSSFIGNSSSLLKTPSEEYFYSKVLNITDGIDDAGSLNFPLTISLAVAWLLVFLVLVKGIQSLGKVVYFTSIFPYVLLTIMLVRGVTLPGSMQGLKYYLSPDFAKLTDARVWSDAAVQIFYSLGTCLGTLIAMSSYNKFDNNCLRDALLVPIINCATSVYSGLVIFSVLGFMAHVKGVDVSDVASSGPGLVFVVYPEGLSQMPVAPVWAILFFFMMLNLGLSSQFGMVECVLAAVIDNVPFVSKTNTRIYTFRAFACIVFFLFGLPMVTQGGFYVFYVFDTFVGGFPLLIIGFLECVSLNHIYGYDKFAEDIQMMLGKKPSAYFKVCWCFISPFILLATIIFLAAQYETLTLFGTYTFPAWSMAFGWSLVAIPCVLIILAALWRFVQEGLLEVIKSSTTSTSDWGPANPEDRTGRYLTKAVYAFEHDIGDYNRQEMGSENGGFIPVDLRHLPKAQEGKTEQL